MVTQGRAFCKTPCLHSSGNEPTITTRHGVDEAPGHGAAWRYWIQRNTYMHSKFRNRQRESVLWKSGPTTVTLEGGGEPGVGRRGPFCGVGHVLVHNLGADFRATFSCENPLNCTPKMYVLYSLTILYQCQRPRFDNVLWFRKMPLGKAG